ncbi:Tetratricopeptide repeat-containing protein [Kibdelosporangium aridum]|uniref:Tetratricopeptide repeat-containing protein n=2 Tax=Kibdelosporangium aridum TaxID=2030 RepID=A0A1W2CTE3_KIBAR|nr:Tetratricopeptide repeat-containing protein [Kibdelosporangium aridum]
MTRDLDPVNKSAPEPMQALAEKLRDCMRKAEYPSLRELAKGANLSASTVSEALAGSRVPSWLTVSSILKACDVQLSQYWAKLHKDAKAAETQWRKASGTGLPADLRPQPGTMSIRPPIGDLPSRVRGRDELLDQLFAEVANTRSAIQVLHGLGGCGKTTVALELARRGAESGCSVFWINGDQRDQLVTGMREVAREIGVPDEDVDESWSGRASAPDLLWRYLDAAERQWILIVDNADKPDVLASGSSRPGDGTGWVRPSSGGVTVVTTRVGSPDVWGHRADLHHVEVLEADDAADMLIDLAGHAGDRADARELADRLGGLPLALMYAGTYLRRAARGAGLLRRTGLRSDRINTFVAYQRALGDAGLALLDHGLNNMGSTEDLERLHRKLISRTWEMSLDLLETQGIRPARVLMRLISCFAPAPLPVDLIDMDVMTRNGLLPETTIPEEVDTAIEALVDFNILDVAESRELTAVPEGVGDPPLPCLVGHRLVLEATAARVRALPEAEQTAVWRTVATWLEAATSIEPEEAWNWDWWQLIDPHIRAVVAAVPDHDEDLLVSVLTSGLRCFAFLVFAERPADIKNFVDAMVNKANALGKDHPTRLALSHREVFLKPSHDQREMNDYRSILQVQTRVLGADDPETLITHHNWAHVLWHVEGAETAEQHMRHVVQARTKVLGPVNPYTLLSRNDWAKMLADVGRQEEAEAELRASVNDCRRDRGGHDAVTLAQVVQLVKMMNKRGHYDAAKAEYRHFIDKYPPASDLSASTRSEIADILGDQKRYAEAEAEYRAALKQLLEVRDIREHRNVSMKLTRNLRAQKKFDEAIEYVSELIESCEDLPADDSFLLAARHQYGDLLHSVERYAEAEAELTAVLEIRARTFTSEDSVVLAERHCRAHTLQRLGRRGEATSELGEVAGSLRKLVGAEHTRARDATWCHAMALLGMDRLAEALSELETCLGAELMVFGPEHRSVLITRRMIAETCHKLGLWSSVQLRNEFDELLGRFIECDGEDGSAVTGMKAYLARLGDE